MVSKNTICLGYDGTALDAVQFYAKTFSESAVGAIHRAPGDYPAGKQGDVLTVEFTVIGIPCLGLNGGPAFRHSEAFSFQVATDDQAETDRLKFVELGVFHFASIQSFFLSGTVAPISQRRSTSGQCSIPLKFTKSLLF